MNQLVPPPLSKTMVCVEMNSGGGGQIMRSVEQRGVTQLDCRERMDGTGRHDDKSTASKRKRINGGNGP